MNKRTVIIIAHCTRLFIEILSILVSSNCIYIKLHTRNSTQHLEQVVIALYAMQTRSLISHEHGTEYDSMRRSEIAYILVWVHSILFDHLLIQLETESRSVWHLHRAILADFQFGAQQI